MAASHLDSGVKERSQNRNRKEQREHNISPLCDLTFVIALQAGLCGYGLLSLVSNPVCPRVRWKQTLVTMANTVCLPHKPKWIDNSGDAERK